MPELCNSTLIEALASTLETMAFVSLSPPEGHVAGPDEAVLVSIDVFGRMHRSVQMVTSLQLGRILMDNTLSADPSETLVMPNPHDPLVELLNITCGTLLRMLDVKSRLEMSVPQIRPFAAAEEWDAFIARGDCDVLLADGIVVAIRMMEG